MFIAKTWHIWRFGSCRIRMVLKQVFSLKTFTNRKQTWRKKWLFNNVQNTFDNDKWTGRAVMSANLYVYMIAKKYSPFSSSSSCGRCELNRPFWISRQKVSSNRWQVNIWARGYMHYMWKVPTLEWVGGSFKTDNNFNDESTKFNLCFSWSYLFSFPWEKKLIKSTEEHKSSLRFHGPVCVCVCVCVCEVCRERGMCP